jgi:hypothetical protein
MTDLTMNEVFGVAGLVTVIPVFEHAEVRLEKVEASSESWTQGASGDRS